MATSNSFMCNISFDYAFDPVVCHCTPPHLFDMPCFEKWLALTNTCPCTRVYCPFAVDDGDIVEAAFPGIYQYILDNNLVRPVALTPVVAAAVQLVFDDPVPDLILAENSDDSSSDDDDDFVVPDRVYTAARFYGNLVTAHNVRQFTSLYTHEHVGSAAQLLRNTVSASNIRYLFLHGLFNQSVQLRTFLVHVNGRSSRAILRNLSQHGIFVYTFARTGDLFLFDSFPYTTHGTLLVSMGYEISPLH